MNLKKILIALLDAAIVKWPTWAGVFNLLRPFLLANLPADGGGIQIVGAAPDSIKEAVTTFLNSLIDKTDRWLLKIGLRAFVGLVPQLIDLAWDSIFTGSPKPVFETADSDIDAVFLEAADAA